MRALDWKEIHASPRELREEGMRLLSMAVELETSRTTAIKRFRKDMQKAILAHARYGDHPTVKIVAEAFRHVSFELFRPNRKAYISMPRHILAWLLREQTRNLSQTARMMGRNHTTILHSYRVVANRARLSPVFAARLAVLKAQCEEAQKALAPVLNLPTAPGMDLEPCAAGRAESAQTAIGL